MKFSYCIMSVHVHRQPSTMPLNVYTVPNTSGKISWARKICSFAVKLFQMFTNFEDRKQNESKFISSIFQFPLQISAEKWMLWNVQLKQLVLFSFCLTVSIQHLMLLQCKIFLEVERNEPLWWLSMTEKSNHHIRGKKGVTAVHKSVSSHRLIKIRKDLCSNPHQDLGLIKYKYSSGDLLSFFFTMPLTSLVAVVFPPNSSRRSAQNTDVLASASGPQGHHVLAEVSGHV